MAVLERSLNGIIQRHETLRTTFAERNGKLIQVVLKSLNLTLPIVNLHKFYDTERQVEIERINRKEAQQAFDLREGPVLRFKLLRLNDDDHILIIVWHHIVTDAWSIGIFIRELMILYEAFLKGQSAVLPDLKIQYVDFAAWQNQWLQGEFLKRELDFWKNHLEGCEPLLRLPTDRPRPNIRSYHGKTESFSFSKKLSNQLFKLSRENDVTLFMTLLSAFKTLLYFYTGQENITVGTPVANRNRKELENLIGYFSNSLALYTDLSGDPSFLTLLKRVSRKTTAAYAHQDTPFDKVVEALNPKRTLSYSPVFQVLFALQNTPKPRISLPELTINVLGMWQALDTARLDLFFELEETDEGLRGLVEYSTDLFDSTTIKTMVENYRTLLEMIVDNPKTQLSELQFSRQQVQPHKKLNLHHFGYACRNIKEGIEHVKKIYDVVKISEIIFDELQNAHLCFAETNNGINIELIAGAPVASFLKKGVNLYHTCYEVPDIFHAIECFRRNGATIVSEPKPAKLFSSKFSDSSLCAFLNTDLGLIELLQTEKTELLNKLSINSRAHREKHESQLIAIAATFTAEPVLDSLSFWAQELQISSHIKIAPYNQVFQQLLNQNSLFYQNQAGVNIVLLRFEDWLRFKDITITPSETPSIFYELIEQSVKELITYLKEAANRATVPYLIFLCPVAPSINVNEERRLFLQQMESTLVKELTGIRGIYLVTSTDLNTMYPVKDFYDAQADHLGNIPYTPLFFAALGTAIARKIFVLQQTIYKVIALDCDQTLWRGICGEDGPKGVMVDAPRKALQEFMVNQKDSGMLLCLCSKNNADDVWQVFDHQRSMPLQKDHLVSWQLNWLPKSENLKKLSEELKLGLDSFIFIDDNPVDCAEVQASHPEVLTIQLPEDPKRITKFLQHFWALDHLQVNREDKERTAYYQKNLERRQALLKSPSFEDFLHNLNLKVKVTEMTPKEIPRVAQLTQRTNQFNATAYRRSESDIQKLLQLNKYSIYVADVKDRFGDYGLVGVIICLKGKYALMVDTFLLSCRVLGRGVECLLLNHLGKIAESRRLKWVEISYIPTSKNKPVHIFLDSIRQDFKISKDGGYQYRLEASFCQNISYSPILSHTNDTLYREASSKVSGPAPVALLSRIATDLAAPEQILMAMQDSKLLSGKDSVHRRQEKMQPFIPARNETEKQMADLWAKCLQVKEVGIYDSFFGLGGNSLLAVQLISQVCKYFQIDLPLNLLMNDLTVAAMVQIIETVKQQGIEALDFANPSIDLDAEVVLDPAINPADITARGDEHNPSAIFLTGSTGFLGAFILKELLEQTQAKIFCLVRSSNIKSAKQRIIENLQQYEIYDESRGHRIIPIVGDLSLPKLGLSEQEFQKLAGFIDIVYHAGAMVNFACPYYSHKASNVTGTQEILRLASISKVKPVHFVSTVAVFNSTDYTNGTVVKETDPLPEGKRIYGGYAQSKWVVEKLMAIARSRGLPVCVYRPAEITGHSENGIWNTNDAVCRIIKGTIQLGKFPNVKLNLQMTPVDYVAKALVYLSRQKQAFNNCFYHLTSPYLQSLQQVAQWMIDYGYLLEEVSYQKWQEELGRLSTSDNSNPILSILPIFFEKVTDEDTLFEALSKRPRFENQLTLKALAGTGITCLHPNEFLASYFKYLIERGFLKAPPDML